MSDLSMTFWPNPVLRTHAGEMRWYFNVGLRVEHGSPVRLYRYRGAWFDMAGRLQEVKEEPIDIALQPRKPVSYPDLWVTSALSEFRYQLTVFGRDLDQREVRGDATLLCQ